ncbi:GDSL esterase/lipase At5g14450, partial [Striga asiatica]
MNKLLMILLICPSLSLTFTTSVHANYNDKKTNLEACYYSALYNYGDSNSDTGGIAAAFYPPASPSGVTYFGLPAGRASDGRLIIDFIADSVGIPYLSAYLDSIGSNYQQGANFATGGATIGKPNETWFATGVSPFPLEIQVEHYTQLKDRAPHLYNQSKDECVRNRLPKSDLDLSKALFTLDIGQNDVAFGIRTLSYQLQKEAIPRIVAQFISQIEVLYERGGRTFWIHNTGPIGCLPVAIAKVQKPAPPGYLDEFRCVKTQNDVALLFNKVLKDEIVKLRANLSNASIVYVDVYAAKYELITTAKNQGFEDPFTTCCGYHGIDYDVYCGNTGNVNGTQVFAGSCPNPSKVISWDGVHYSEAANKWIADRIVSGSLSDPPVAVSRACHKQASASWSVDDIGCLKDPNDVVQQLSKVLKDEIVKHRTNLSEAATVYVDMYAAKYQLIVTANRQ